MSAGAFIQSKYESTELGAIMPIRVQPETLGLTVNTITNGAPTAPTDLALFASVSKNRGAHGVGCRKAQVRWTGAVPDGYKPAETLSVPILTEAMYATCIPGSAGTYLANAIVVVSRTPENAR